MAKKQTRRSISVSRTTYERLKAFCESNNISMSQLVETRVNDFLGPSEIMAGAPAPGVGPTGSIGSIAMAARPMDTRPASHAAPVASNGGGAASPHPAHPAPPSVPMTSAAARFAVEPPPPIIKRSEQAAAPAPVEKRAEQIFTF